MLKEDGGSCVEVEEDGKSTVFVYKFKDNSYFAVKEVIFEGSFHSTQKKYYRLRCLPDYLKLIDKGESLCAAL